jgi:sterol desaturase/sphingolipid hydroxylase (fatty acid hydroxylase superfamily)
MERKLILYALPLFAVAVLLDFFIDTAKKTNRYRITDSITSLTIGFLGTTAGLLTLGFVGFFYNGIFRWFHLFVIKDSIWSWALAAIIYDFFYYWMHRAHHRVNILWASHATHHNSEYFNFTTALRQSALGFLTVWIFFLPMAFLGFTYEQYIFGAGLSTLYGFFTHTEFVRFIPYIEYIFIGPSSHRVHHGINDKYLDKNYGSILSIWDHIFGSYAFEKAEDPVRFGTIPLLNSFNPFMANLTVYWLMLKDAFLCKSWRDKFLLWINKTGWRPADCGISWTTADGEKQIQANIKYDPQVAPKELVYVIFNFGMVALATIHLMLTAKLHSSLWSSLYILILWLAMFSNSFFLQGKDFRFRFEWVRLVITGGVAFYASQENIGSIDVFWFSMVCALSFVMAIAWSCFNFLDIRLNLKTKSQRSQ